VALFPFKRITTGKSSGNFSISPPWLVVTVFFTVVAIFLAIGSISIVIPFYIFGVFAVGLFLYQRYPIFYINFVVWMWLVAGMIPRLIGSQMGMLMPAGNAATSFVTIVTIATLVKNFPRLYREKDQELLPLLMVFFSIGYGCLVGLFRIPYDSYFTAVGDFLESLSPVLLAFHLYINWRSYPALRKSLSTSYLLLTIVMGSYGIYQFIAAPYWDTQYMINSTGRFDSFLGLAEALKIRVFGTMSNPFTYSLNLMPGLILLTVLDGKLRFLGMALGYPAFLLTTYRTAWYSWLFTILTLFISIKAKKQIKFLPVFFLIGLIASVFSSMEPFSEIISTRLSSFQDLQNDGSGMVRMEQFNAVWDTVLKTWDGYGVGSEPYMGLFVKNLDFLSGFDMGVPQIFLSLGLIASAVYFLGLSIILYKLFVKFPMASTDLFAGAARAIALGSIIRIFTSSILIGEFAFPIWFFIGLCLAARRYHQETQRLAAIQT
jgi:hypothetical protein